MVELFETFIAKGADYFQSQIKLALMPVGPYLRKLSIGFILVLISAVSWFAGLLFLLLSFFFYLSRLSEFSLPALWSGLLAIGLALVFVLIGLLLLRRPR